MQYKIFHISQLYQQRSKLWSKTDIHLPFILQILDKSIFILLVQNSHFNLWITYTTVNKTPGSHHPEHCVL